jgi:hypothetical protein
MTVPGEQVNITGALRETFQIHLYSATCTDRRETIQLLFLVEQAAELRVVVLLSDLKTSKFHVARISTPITLARNEDSQRAEK